jgi:hypothetical protein
MLLAVRDQQDSAGRREDIAFGVTLGALVMGSAQPHRDPVPILVAPYLDERGQFGRWYQLLGILGEHEAGWLVRCGDQVGLADDNVVGAVDEQGEVWCRLVPAPQQASRARRRTRRRQR